MKRTTKIIYIVVFLTAVLLPTLLTVAGVNSVNFEKRKLAEKPSILADGKINLAYTKQFDDYFADNFALRPVFVTAYAKLAAGLFNTSTAENVVMGKNGFLYFKQTLPTYLSQDALTDAQIDEIANKLLKAQQDLSAQGKAFIFVVAPNKNTIYPENMPARYVPSQTESNMTRLYAKLQIYGVNYVNLTDDLIAGKPKVQIYHSHDSHWNNLGAVVGYNAMMQSVAEQVPTHTYTDFLSQNYTVQYTHKGDLAVMLYPASNARDMQMDYDIDIAFTSARPIVNLEAMQIVTQNESESTKALIFRDSFFNALIPFFSQSFEYIEYSRSVPYDFDYAAAEDVDIVILEIVERNLPLLIENLK